jgi:hypothetical protein
MGKLWQKLKGKKAKSDAAADEISTSVESARTEYLRQSVMMTGIDGGVDPTLKQAAAIDSRRSEQYSEAAGVGAVDEDPADTGAGLEADIDKYASELEKWNREDKRV